MFLCSDTSGEVVTSQSHQYLVPGEYTVNVTAYNLHSEQYGYVKYTHNLSRSDQLFVLAVPIHLCTLDIVIHLYNAN